MRNRLILITLFFGVLLHGQGQPEINTTFPDLILPSPSVAALMKFEEIPVNNYSGLPDIKVPVFSENLHDKLELNIFLSYHPNGIKIKDLASDIGLGWSLNGIGSISRTVNGYPDEILEPNKKIGIYKSNPIASDINYYDALKVVNGQSTDYELLNEYLWGSDTYGYYDTKHDLWQYNFMGYSGRFIIEKKSNGNLEVKLLDNNTLKIINHYDNQSYFPTGFTVYDDYGYRYEFEVSEDTSTTSSMQSMSFSGIPKESLDYLYSFKSAFHLTKVYFEDVLLLDVVYRAGDTEQIINTSTKMVYADLGPNTITLPAFEALILQYLLPPLNSFSEDFVLGLFKPAQITSSLTNTYLTKKINHIEVINKGEIHFYYQTGRPDENYLNKQQVLVLKSIEVKDLYNNVVKKLNLNHTSYDATKTKLFLKGIVQEASNQTIPLYEFEYKIPPTVTGAFEDKWGYFKFLDLFGGNVDCDIHNVDSFVLNKMKLPTGGLVEYEYESNTYSHIGNQTQVNFDENEHNWNSTGTNVFITSINNNHAFFSISNPVNKVVFSSGIPDLSGSPDWALSLYRDNVEYPLYSQNSCINGFCIKTLENLPVGNYTLKLIVFTTNQNSLQSNLIVSADIKTKKTGENYKNYFYGGGFRIKSISTFEDSQNTLIPVTKKDYKYNLFNNIYSSGSLASFKPLFNYVAVKTIPQLALAIGVLPPYDIFYQVTSTVNVLNTGITKGSPVGYKNVAVDIHDLGKTEYEYTSPLDFPDEIVISTPSFSIPNISNEYKRGLLTSEKVYDVQNRKLKEQTFSYLFDEYNVISGLAIYGIYDTSFNSYPTYKLFPTYNDYINAKNNGHCITNNFAYNYCQIGEGLETFSNHVFIQRNPITERTGWPKLSQKNTKQYFYEGTTQNILETTEYFTYNSLNKKIAFHTVTDSRGDNLLTEYRYHTGNFIYDRNRIGEIEQIKQFKNSDLIGTQKIGYSNTFDNNIFHLPQVISTAKGAQSLESEVIFTKYDVSGKVLELQQADGIPVCFIYAYHHTQPVAKLENISYSQIPQNLITAIQTATDAQVYNEQAVLSALTALRNDPALANAMVTTYTYKPLVGVSSITDPKGYTATYHYDPFGRPEYVKDAEGNILSENQYHYRTQN